MEEFSQNTPKIEKPKIKEGVDFVFEHNPDLTSIGTPDQYSKYIDSIFPRSKIKNIVYHGSKNAKLINSFATRYYDEEDSEYVNGAYFSAHLEMSKGFEHGHYKGEDITHSGVIAVVINCENPKYFGQPTGAGLVNEETFIDMVSFTDEQLEELFKAGYDSAYTDILDETESFDNEKYTKVDYPTEIVIFKSEQAHILGSKQDTEGFKKFVENNKDSHA